MHFLNVRKYFNGAAFIALILLIAGCGDSDSKDTSAEAKLAFGRVIPKPVSAKATGKSFLLTGKTTIVADSSSELGGIVDYLTENLKTVTGLSLNTGSGTEGNKIILSLNGGTSSLG